MEYRTIDKMNQSLLKKILISPSAFLAQQQQQGDSNKSHFVLGSLVDDMLLNPKVLDDKYFRMKAINISDKVKQITLYIHDVFNTYEDGKWNDSELDKVILKACLVYSHQPKWGDDAKIKNIRKAGEHYFIALNEAKGRRIVSDADYNKATIAVAALKSDPITGVFLKETKDCTIIKHKVIQFELDGVKIKGELDEVYIDHMAKTITPIDYKTTGMPISLFNNEFWKYRYDFQAATYFYGIQLDSEIKEYLDKGYTLLDFRYIVVEIESNNSPLVHRVSDKVMDIGLHGGTRTNGWKLEGLHNALNRYKFHKESDKWDYPKEYYSQEYLDIEI